MIYRHLDDGREAELVDQVPELWRWAMSYGPLRGRARRAAGMRGHGAAGPSHATLIPSERILRDFAALVAEKGYAETTIADIAARRRSPRRLSTRTLRARRTHCSPRSTPAVHKWSL